MPLLESKLNILNFLLYAGILININVLYLKGIRVLNCCSLCHTVGRCSKKQTKHL